MSAGTDDEERAWAADKRDFVADSRDDGADEQDVAADARDAVADARDSLAEAREAQLNQWEEQLEARARRLGLAVGAAPAASERDDARAARTRADEERADTSRERDETRAGRDAATERRLAEGRSTLLALAFASIAEQLYDADTYDEVLTRIAQAAVATVAGGEMASVTLLEQGTYRTGGSTAPAATSVDQEQYDAGEGPSLDAITMPLVDAPSFPDERWPLLGARSTAHGVQSSLAYHLNTYSDERGETETGSLNIYASKSEAFEPAAQEVGFILAAHASLAARAVGGRITLDGFGHELQQALLSREVIDQAKGILMERLRTTPEDAFDILKSTSQRLNAKLREITRTNTESGEVNQEHPQQP